MVYSIGIIGKGAVGSAIYRGLLDIGYSISFHDPNIDNSSPLNYVIYSSDILFICVPTPSDSNGSIDLSTINNVIREIMIRLHRDAKKLIIIKSTVIPGTVKSYYNTYKELYNDVKFVYCPEFLDDDTAYEDFIKPCKVVIGHTGNSYNIFGTLLENIFLNFIDKEHIFHMDSKEAEMVKYMTNSYYTTKVTFANAIYDICQELEIDYNNVKDVFVVNPRIGNSHFDIFHKGGRGAGGKCLPKDLSALIDMSKKLNIKNGILSYVKEINDGLLKNSNKL